MAIFNFILRGKKKSKNKLYYKVVNGIIHNTEKKIIYMLINREMVNDVHAF